MALLANLIESEFRKPAAAAALAKEIFCKSEELGIKNRITFSPDYYYIPLLNGKWKKTMRRRGFMAGGWVGADDRATGEKNRKTRTKKSR